MEHEEDLLEEMSAAAAAAAANGGMGMQDDGMGGDMDDMNGAELFGEELLGGEEERAAAVAVSEAPADASDRISQRVRIALAALRSGAGLRRQRELVLPAPPANMNALVDAW